MLLVEEDDASVLELGSAIVLGVGSRQQSVVEQYFMSAWHLCSLSTL
jgi:hypothetical protein